ncbi:MAG TPA: hypothetical protein VGN72_15380 [Tepidisphaeraceae bacterium]|nr:hypothetical protein [Tepidisphaeraceae bacterium]
MRSAWKWMLGGGIVAWTMATSHVSAAVLFYGGDVSKATFQGHAPNYESPANYFDRNYNAFTVPASQTWTVQGLFANIVVQDGESVGAITQGRFDIRQGMSAGNGGTVIASGTTSASAAFTGEMVIFDLYPVASLTASLPAALTLPAGDYWVAFTPFSQTQNRLLLASTERANSIGTSTGPSLRNSNFFDLNYDAGAAFAQSIGLNGTSVPEPATLTFIGGTAVLLLLRRPAGGRDQ